MSYSIRDRIDFAQAMYRSLRDSADVTALLDTEEFSSLGAMTRLIPLLESTPEGRSILRDRPRMDSSTVDLDALARLPAGTLGHAYAQHMHSNRLDLDALAVPVTRGSDETSNYLLERVRQTHDIWHTMLALDTQAHNEVLVHTFQWPQLRMPYSALVMVFGVLKHFVGEQRWALMRRALRRAWLAGEDARPLIAVRWENHWDRPIEALRRELLVVPATRW